MKPIKLKFRIEKISEHILQGDLKTIVTNSYYKLYKELKSIREVVAEFSYDIDV